MKLSFAEILKSVPVLRILLFLAAGLLVRHHSGAFDFSGPLILLLLFMLFLAFIILKRLFYHHLLWLPGMAVAVFFFFTGFALKGPETTSLREPESLYWYAEILDYPLEKENSFLIRIKISNAVDHPEPQISGKHVYAYISKESPVSFIKPGDFMLFRAVLKTPSNTGNPGEFDYAAWLRSANVFFQCFIADGEWRLFRQQNARLKYMPLHIRQRIMERIVNAKGEDEAKRVLSAISLGQRQGLDKELKQAYADAGAIHVMAVSGLHVGMIWWFFSSIFSFLNKSLLGRSIHFLLVCAILWLYAVMTGLSPSVTRSVLMFTMIALGKLLHRHSRSYNTVMLAAFLQIMLKPSVLWEPGFQFSYSAVFGILLFHNLFRNNRSSSIPVISYFTDLIRVSLAAQIFTWVLSVRYFNRFPSFFILTNLLVIPLVTLTMVFFMLGCMFYMAEPIQLYLFGIALKLTKLMNEAVRMIDAFPGAVLDQLSMTFIQSVLAFIFPLVLLYFVHYKGSASIYIMIMISIFFLLSGTLNKIQKQNKKEFIVYNIPGYAVATCRDGPRQIVFSTAKEEEIGAILETSLASYRAAEGISAPVYVDLLTPPLNETEGLKIFSLPGKANYIILLPANRIVLLYDPGAVNAYLIPPEPLLADLVVITGKYLIDPEQLARYFRAGKLILSSSLNPYYQNLEISDSNQLFIDVRKAGAFVYPLKSIESKKLAVDLGN